MANLTFYKDNQELIKYVLRHERTTVGRSSQADICLPDGVVSRVHFAVSLLEGRFVLTDKSTNGTLVNHKPVVTCELDNGDTIQVGEWNIVFTSEPGTVTRRITQADRRDPTEVIAFDRDSSSVRLRRAYVKTKAAKGKAVPIERDILSIGKSPSNDIVLTGDKFVSTFHCKIENRRGQYFLKDLGSTNGTFLGSQQVIETALPDRAELVVGRTAVEFFVQEESQQIQPLERPEYAGMVGKTTGMRSLFALIDKVAPSDVTVLVQGETGTGKDLVARALHQMGNRVEGKLVTLNCSAIAKDLIESELFGHEKGAFTSANQQRKGAFEEAHRGTLFLDEIGDLPLELQPKLLRALENREVKRVGSNQLIDVDVRIVAASNKNLAQMVSNGQFREDLYFRLSVFPIEVPPLRERVDDIPVLCEYFLDQESPGTAQGLSSAALEAMMSYKWPGNVRELKNVLARAQLNSDGKTIDHAHLSFAPEALREQTHLEPKADSGDPEDQPKTLKDFEREKILDELVRNNWNKKKTAASLGIAKTTLFEKIKKYNLKP